MPMQSKPKRSSRYWRESMPELKRFCVISYDDNEQQTMTDFVLAEDGDAAKVFVGLVRGEYADIVDAMDSEELRKIADGLDRAITYSPLKGDATPSAGTTTIYPTPMDMALDLGEQF